MTPAKAAGTAIPRHIIPADSRICPGSVFVPFTGQDGCPHWVQPSPRCDLPALRTQIQQARNDYYEQAIGHGEKAGHEEQEARAYGRVEMCDEVLGWLAPEGEG